MDKMLERALKASVRDEVAARLGGVAASPAQVEELVAESVGELRLDYGAQLDPSEAHALVRALIDDFLYYVNHLPSIMRLRKSSLLRLIKSGAAF